MSWADQGGKGNRLNCTTLWWARIQVEVTKLIACFSPQKICTEKNCQHKLQWITADWRYKNVHNENWEHWPKINYPTFIKVCRRYALLRRSVHNTGISTSMVYPIAIYATYLVFQSEIINWSTAHFRQRMNSLSHLIKVFSTANQSQIQIKSYTVHFPLKWNWRGIHRELRFAGLVSLQLFTSLSTSRLDCHSAC